MKASFTWVNFTLRPAVQHGFALPLRCAFPSHLCSIVVLMFCRSESLYQITVSIATHGAMPLACQLAVVLHTHGQVHRHCSSYCLKRTGTLHCGSTKPQWSEVRRNEQYGGKVKVCGTTGGKVDFVQLFVCRFPVDTIEKIRISYRISHSACNCRHIWRYLVIVIVIVTFVPFVVSL